MADWVDVAEAESVPEGGYQVVDLDDVQVAIFRLQGELYAIEDVCTHDGGILTGGEIQGREVVCPRHGARFDITTGAVTAPPAYEDVYSFPLRVQDGRIQLKDERWD